METLKINEIPEIDFLPTDGRQVRSLTFYGNSEWVTYLQPEPNGFYRFPIIDFVTGAYLSEEKASEDDYELLLGTLIAKHLSYPSTINAYMKVEQSIQMLTAILQKLKIFEDVDDVHSKLSFVIESEIEYAFILCRAIYDEVNSVIAELASLLKDNEGKPVVQTLRDSFARMALDGENTRSVEELSHKWGLPIPLAEIYSQSAEHFRNIRAIRVSIEHHGRRVPRVLMTPEGFAIPIKHIEAWNALPVWKMHVLLPNELGSVKALVAFMINHVLLLLDTCAKSINQISTDYVLPQAMYLNLKLFLTSPSIGVLKDLDKTIANPWNEGGESVNTK